MTFDLFTQVSTSHKICRISKTPVLGFAETVEKVFEYGPPWAKRYSKTAKEIVDYALMATYYSAGCVYIVFIGTTFHDVCNAVFNLNEDVMTIRIYILLTMVPIILIGQIRSLKMLVPFSGSANAFILVVFGIVLYYIFKVPLEFDNRELVASWTKWPFFFR